VTVRRRRAPRTALLAAAWAALACAAGGAWAAPTGAHAATATNATGAVAVIRAPVGDSVLEEASLRLRSELDAAGTSNRLIDCSGPGNPEPHDCPDASAVARISLFREEGIATLQVLASLPDGLELRRHVRVPAEMGGSDPSVLAVRAVELLRDLYLDIPRVARRPQPAAATTSRPTAGRDTVAAPPAPDRSVAGSAFLGAGVLQGRWGLSAAAGPSLGFGITFQGRLRVLATVAGPFAGSSRTPAGTDVDTWQTLVAAQVRYELGSSRIRPYALAGGGLYSLRAQAEQPNTQRSPLVAVGVGVVARIFPWLALTLDAQEVVTWWILDVTAGDTVIGRAGGPSELVQAGLMVTAP
jgi:hypothetical protein